MENRLFTDPATGDTLRFVKTSAETNGELLEIEVHYTPAHGKPPAHYHPRQQEHFEVMAGSITVQMNGDQRDYRAGESFDVPAGTVHAMWNAGESTVQMKWQIRPALKTQQFFEAIWGSYSDRKPGDTNSPNLLQSAVWMQAYSDEFRLVSPPPPIQKMVLGILAPLGRAMGYNETAAR